MEGANANGDFYMRQIDGHSSTKSQLRLAKSACYSKADIHVSDLIET